MNAPSGVLNSLEAASGSSLTDDGYKICSRDAIKRLHSIHSIFHLLIKIKNYRIREIAWTKQRERGDLGT